MQAGLGDAEGGGEIQVARRIYVGNLSYSVAWQDLKDHFKPVGEGIDRVLLPWVLVEGRVRGW